MSKYPEINKVNFYEKLTKKLDKFKIKKKPDDMQKICYPKEFTLQPHQKLAPALINPKSPYRGMLLYYGIGAGKTCSSIKIAEGWIKKATPKYKIVVVVPASLKGNYKNELRSKCTGDEYISDEDRYKLTQLNHDSDEYKKIIHDSDIRIAKNYTIYSYNKFIALIESNKISLDKTILIIDEIQNLVSEFGSYYKILYAFIKSVPKNARIILLSATPIFDKPSEIALTLNLLPLPKLIPVGRYFYKTFFDTVDDGKGNMILTIVNLDLFKQYIKGFVSYYRGAPPFTYPKKEIHYVNCYMREFQFKSYVTALAETKREMDVHANTTYVKGFRESDIFNLPVNFFLGMRMISNVAYPNKKIEEEGFQSFKDDHLQLGNLKKYSIKFYKILQKIKQSDGPVFVYSNFRSYGGIKPFIKVLEAHSFKDYALHTEGPKRFAVWSGDETIQYREKFKHVVNGQNNKDGSQIKIIIGSPAVREGVSFLRVSQVHIMEPYWNFSRMDQVIGRAVRFCSHKDMKKSDRKVDIYIYIAVHKNDKKTIDHRILQMAEYKKKINTPFEDALKEAAVDCRLNKMANVFDGEKDIVCQK